MEFNRQNIRSQATTAETYVLDEGLRAYMLKVYNYMASGVLLTGVISLFLFKLSVVYCCRRINNRSDRPWKCAL